MFSAIIAHMFASLEAVAKLRRELDAGEAAWLQEVADYDRSYDWRAEGFASAASALRNACHMSHGVARGHVELARKLEALPEVAAAFGEGAISARHATVIASACTPERAAAIGMVEAALVGYAREATPHELGGIMRHVTDALDGDGGAAADETRYRRRRLHMSQTLDGMLVEDGLFDPEAALIRNAAIDAEMARDLMANDDRTTSQRRADASTNIMRLYLDRGEGPESHSVRPHATFVVHVDSTPEAADDLVARARTERAETSRLSAAMVEMLLCDCDVSRVIVAGRSEILDVGRATPTVTPAQWKALVVRDRHCRHPDCDRPPSHCQAHHVRHWTRGGPTDLANLELLCRHHHREHHRRDAEARARARGFGS
jgi:hypothetical protein